MIPSTQAALVTRRSRSRRVGHSSLSERDQLSELAVQAITLYPASADRQQRVEHVWKHVEGDLNLVIELFAKHRHAVISDLIQNVAKSQRERASPAGHAPRKTVTAARSPSRRPPSPNINLPEQMARASWLRKFEINGQPIGEVTCREARAWLESRKVGNRFVELMIAGISEEDKPIKNYITPAEADAFYKRAQSGR